MSITNQRLQERIDFILNRVRSGLSRTEVMRQFAQQYQTGKTQTWEWYNRALDSLVVVDPIQNKRLRAGIVEMYHAQLVSCQHDMASIQQEIDRVDEWWSLRSNIQERLLTEKDKDRWTQLNRELDNIPKLTVSNQANLIESKNKVRDRIIKLIGELARVHGLLVEEMPWMRAVGVLLDNNLLSSEIAANILDRMQELINNINPAESTHVESIFDEDLEVN